MKGTERIQAHGEGWRGMYGYRYISMKIFSFHDEEDGTCPTFLSAVTSEDMNESIDGGRGRERDAHPTFSGPLDIAA